MNNSLRKVLKAVFSILILVLLVLVLSPVIAYLLRIAFRVLVKE